MVKEVHIADIHGHNTWESIVKDNPDATKFIFHGDYLDSFSVSVEDQKQNLLKIIDFKKQNEDKVILLIGNHDFHYWPGVTDRYSGYKDHARSDFENILRTNKNLFKICYKDEFDNYHSHAGITKTWLSDKGIVTDIENSINELFVTNPQEFGFYFGDYSYYGENKHQSPIWVRPNSLTQDSIPFNQVVGHTTFASIQERWINGRVAKVYLCDCLPYEYLTCINGTFNINKL